MTARACAGPCGLELDEMEYEVLLHGPNVLLDDHCIDCRKRQYGCRMGDVRGQRYQMAVRAIKRRTREAA